MENYDNLFKRGGEITFDYAGNFTIRGDPAKEVIKELKDMF